jgi:superfamily II DNA or RNA helicase
VTVLIRSRQAPGLRSIAYSVQFGYLQHATSALPDRLYVNVDALARPLSFIPMEPDADVEHLPTPTESLIAPAAESWANETRRSVARLEAMWLLIEDRHRLLDVQSVDPLAHQASLVEYVMARPELRRVLVADEVGLGKTVEAGLIIKRLAEAAVGKHNVLYLTEARLVASVCEELKRLGLRPRPWTSSHQEARLDSGDSDALVVASMHRAVFRLEGGVNHFETVARSGPWDVIVVDEAHHLTDWSADGTDPQQRMRLVRRLLKDRLAKDGRLLLLTGTPHQGHGDRFRNLLRLMDDNLEDEAAAHGRVFYRIKEDVRDWDGRPLFPTRQVFSPTRLDVGPAYREWFSQVHTLLTPTAGTRTGAWRRAQALQWCASSPDAGLAYLIRLALRLGYDFGGLPALRSALLAIRPYRGGAPDEPVEVLQERLQRVIDANEVLDQDGTVSSGADLAQALERGAQLVREDAIGPKLRALEQKLRDPPDEKLVVFAQPVETVYLLARRLEATIGPASVSLIVGGQDDDERKAAIDQFWKPRGARVLVSSRSGGEGINLQIARRLVHFDVPWNPMEMEQRVGRIHRYGSVDKILVDTLVLAGSREERVLDRCRARLAQIVRDVDADRFELLFGRTMALIPLEELEQLMAGEMFGTLTPHDAERLDHLVQEGYHRWQDADAEFRAASVTLRTLQRGPVGEDDLRAFVQKALDAKPLPGWKRRIFEEPTPGGELRIVDSEVEVLQLSDGSVVTLGRRTGIVVPPTEDHAKARPLGLNDDLVARAIRNSVGGAARDGKAGDRWVSGAGSCLIDRAELAAWSREAGLSPEYSRSFVIFCYAVRFMEPVTIAREVDAVLRWYVTIKGAQPQAISNDIAARLVRMLRTPRPRLTPSPELAEWGLRAVDDKLITDLRAPMHGHPTPVVFPIAALHVEAG